MNKKNRYLLSIRDPIKRMESGFYQQRKDNTDNDGLSNYKFFGTAEKAENLIVNNKKLKIK